MYKQVILASQSPRRRALLQQLDIEFLVCPAVGEERSNATVPQEYVCDLASAKAQEIAENLSIDEMNCRADMTSPWSSDLPVLIIGADTIVARGTEILGKPVDEEDALRMLHMLQGTTHQVYTGVALFLVQDGRVQRKKTFYEKTDVTFYNVSQEEMEAYVATGDPMDKAGAYGIQSGAARFIQKIHGDYNNVVGLPIARLYQELKGLEMDAAEWKAKGQDVMAESIEKKMEEPKRKSAEQIEGLDSETLARMQKQFAFILELDKEKLIRRQTYLSGAVRKENDAEHAWHMAIMAILLQEYANDEVDVLHAVTMILLHDVVEIDAGDTYAYDEAGKATQAERERKAADRIFALLPEDQAKIFRSYFDEFEAWETPEAKYAHAMDNFQPLMLNRSNLGRSWLEHGVHLSQVLGRNARSAEGSKELWQYAYGMFIQPSIDEGMLLDDVHNTKEQESAIR